jgi:hypothetical protein
LPALGDSTRETILSKGLAEPNDRRDHDGQAERVHLTRIACTLHPNIPVIITSWARPSGFLDWLSMVDFEIALSHDRSDGPDP